MLKAFYQNQGLEAGCDEAGRGSLAGPVVAAAVILDHSTTIAGLDDSKKLNRKKRAYLALQIKKEALSWAVAFVDNHEIDKINILNASIKAMHMAIGQLKTLPQRLLIDGNRFKPYHDIPFHCIIKGDGIYQSIAAASILAKTERDAYMINLSKEFPVYAWDRNKGYPTAHHRMAIVQAGSCSYHRKTFRLHPSAKQIDLFEKTTGL